MGFKDLFGKLSGGEVHYSSGVRIQALSPVDTNYPVEVRAQGTTPFVWLKYSDGSLKFHPSEARNLAAALIEAADAAAKVPGDRGGQE